MDESSKNPTASSPEEDSRALVKAEEVRRDKKRMHAVRQHVKTLHRSLGMKKRGARGMTKERGARR